MTEFDKLWDYRNPSETEKKFLTILADEKFRENLSEHIQLLTQIARTHSLRHQFENAHEWLHKAELILPQQEEIAHIRYYLERGRTFNSSGDKENAKKYFELAYETSTRLKEDFYSIDALHMLAIIAPAEMGIEWNLKAIELATNSTDSRANNWLGSLLNNLGWSYFDKARFDEALETFVKAYLWRQSKDQAYETLLAKWCVARVHRAKGEISVALELQLNLQKEFEERKEEDGYVFEEIAECLCAAGKLSEAKPYFAKAFDILSNDIYLQKREAVRLERIKNLSV